MCKYFVFLCLNNPLYGCITICLSIYLLLDILAVSTFWLLWLVLLSVCMYIYCISVINMNHIRVICWTNRLIRKKWKNNSKSITNQLFYSKVTSTGMVFEKQTIFLSWFQFWSHFFLVTLFLPHQKSWFIQKGRFQWWQFYFEDYGLFINIAVKL